jgi:hypothetical protein
VKHRPKRETTEGMMAEHIGLVMSLWLLGGDRDHALANLQETQHRLNMAKQDLADRRPCRHD